MKKIVFQTDCVLPQLTQISGVVANKCPIQILETVMFQTIEDGTKLLLTASDNETWVSVRCDVVECDADVKFCLNAKDIVTTLRNLSGLAVTLEVDETTHTINGSYRNGKFTFPYQNADEYPSCVVNDVDAKEKTLGSKQLLGAIDAVRFASASDELRPVMNSVHFDFFETHMAVTASDGLKLVKYVDNNVQKPTHVEVEQFTLPKKPAALIATLLPNESENVKVVFTDKNVTFTTSAFSLATRLLEAKYPNYDSVIPRKETLAFNAKISRDAILGALKRVMPMGNTTSELVKLHFAGGKVTISSENYDFSTSASEYIDCDFYGDTLLIGFKGSALAQVVQNVKSDNVLMYFHDASACARIEPEKQLEGFEYVSILMPMLLN